METATKESKFLLPEDLLDELRKTVSKREQSEVVAEALRKELKRLKLKNAIKESFGAWKDKNHPELKGGIAAFIRTLRKSNRPNRSQ